MNNNIRKTKSCVFAAVLLAALLIICCFILFAKYKADKTETPAEETQTPDIPYLSIPVTENEKGESVFAVSVESFINYFNNVYCRRNGNEYLNSTSSDNWYWYSELSPRFGYEATRYQFSADKTVWPMPTVSIYGANNDGIYEIRMTFDDHGYQERFHTLFKELCVCMEKTFILGLGDTEAEELFEALYAQAYTNFFGNHHSYSDSDRPPLYSVYRYDNIGMYCFYGAGNVEICFIPLTAEAINTLNFENVMIIDTEGEQK